MSGIIGCRHFGAIITNIIILGIVLLRSRLSISMMMIVYDYLVGVFVASSPVVGLVLITTMMILVQIIRGTANTSLVLLRDDRSLRRRSMATVVVLRCRVSLLLSSEPIFG